MQTRSPLWRTDAARATTTRRRRTSVRQSRHEERRKAVVGPSISAGMPMSAALPGVTVAQGRNQNWVGSVDPMTRRRRRRWTPRRSKLAVGEQRRWSSGSAATPMQCSTEPRPRRCDGEQHLAYLWQSGGWRRVGAVHLGSPRVLRARRRLDPCRGRLGTRRGAPGRCSPGRMQPRRGEPNTTSAPPSLHCPADAGKRADLRLSGSNAPDPGGLQPGQRLTTLPGTRESPDRGRRAGALR